MRRLAPAAVSLALAIPTLALAAMATNTVERKAKLGGDGERAKVGVLLGCDQAQSARLKVTLTQGSAEGQARALGRGGGKVDCETEDTVFPVAVTARKGSFAAGKATACVLALTDDDARQWCAEVKLVSRSG